MRASFGEPVASPFPLFEKVLMDMSTSPECLGQDLPVAKSIQDLPSDGTTCGLPSLPPSCAWDHAASLVGGWGRQGGAGGYDMGVVAEPVSQALGEEEGRKRVETPDYPTLAFFLQKGTYPDVSPEMSI